MASTIAQSGVYYKDFDISFRAHPVTGKLLLKKNDESIKQALKNLILTNLYERPFRPRFGSDIVRTLFENYTSSTEENLRSYIKTAVNNYEPRVELLSIEIYAEPDLNTLQIGILFRSKNSTTPSSVTITVDRIR